MCATPTPATKTAEITVRTFFVGTSYEDAHEDGFELVCDLPIPEGAEDKLISLSGRCESCETPIGMVECEMPSGDGYVSWRSAWTEGTKVVCEDCSYWYDQNGTFEDLS